MKKAILASTVFLMLVGNAVAMDRSAVTTSPGVSSTNHAESFHNSGASKTMHPGSLNAQSGKHAKTREEVRQELQKHQERMRTDRAYAKEWRSMFEDS